MTTGQNLKQKLSLSGFPKAYIQRVINSAYPIYIVTVDSKFPANYISWSRMKKVLTSFITSAVSRGEDVATEEYRLTPPIDLELFDGHIDRRALIIRRDMIGDYFVNRGKFKETVLRYGRL